MDAPEFDGRLESTMFLDWSDKMNEYIDRYKMSDAQRISMARIRLVTMQNIFLENNYV